MNKKQTNKKKLVIISLLIFLLIGGIAIFLWTSSLAKQDVPIANKQDKLDSSTPPKAEASKEEATTQKPSSPKQENNSSANKNNKPDSNNKPSSNNRPINNNDKGNYPQKEESTPSKNDAPNQTKPNDNPSQTKPNNAPHKHQWINVSPENSAHYEYGVECRAHGYSSGEPMFFMTQEDMFLHHKADNCMSSWGTGFKGLAYKYCKGCGESIITAHVHSFGTIEKTVYTKSVVCECGMRFGGSDGYSAKQNWEYHVQVYTSHGLPKEEHDTYTIDSSSWAHYYQATHACSCGWLPVDPKLVELRGFRDKGFVEIADVVVGGAHNQPL